MAPGAGKNGHQLVATNLQEVDLAEQSTCGEGLAANSVLPRKLGELTAAVAKVLETHMKALDLEDENARQEHAAYVKLAHEHRQSAAQLLTMGEKMAGYRDLPVARHDPNAMTSPEVASSFENFVLVEQELLALLEERVEQDRAMLSEMRRRE
jgi:hypothetical protein